MSTSQAPRTLKEKQRQERELLILTVAEEVFLEKGYYETSMEEIATRVGVAKGTVYLHFPSKEDLVIAILARDAQQVSQDIDEIVALSVMPSEKLRAILNYMYTGFLNKRAMLLYTIYSSMDLRRLFEQKDGCMRPFWEKFSQQITTLLEDGKERGEFNSALPTNVMLSVFLNLLSPKGHLRLIRDESMTLEDQVKYLAEIYFRGIANVIIP